RQTGLRHVTHAPGDAFPLQPSFIWVGRGCYRFAARTVGWTRYEGEKNGEENCRRAVAGVGCCLCPCGCVGSLHWLPPSPPLRLRPPLRPPLPSSLPVIPAVTPTAEPFPAVGFSSFSRKGRLEIEADRLEAHGSQPGAPMGNVSV